MEKASIVLTEPTLDINGGGKNVIIGSYASSRGASGTIVLGHTAVSKGADTVVIAARSPGAGFYCNAVANGEPKGFGVGVLYVENGQILASTS